MAGIDTDIDGEASLAIREEAGINPNSKNPAFFPRGKAALY